MNKIEIKDNYTILHFDEYPILFIGKNYKSEIVIGSFIFEDDDENTMKFFHSIVSYNLAIEFLKRKVPYLEVLKASTCICVVTKDYNYKILNVEEKSFFDIDKTFLPLSTAICPEIENKIILKFEGLIGKSLIITNNITQKYTKQRKTYFVGLESFIVTNHPFHKNYRYNIHPKISSYPNKFVSNSKFISIHKSENKNFANHV